MLVNTSFYLQYIYNFISLKVDSSKNMISVPQCAHIVLSSVKCRSVMLWSNVKFPDYKVSLLKDHAMLKLILCSTCWYLTHVDWSQLKSLLACCCRRKKFFQNAAKMIGPWQLLALRENETAMDVSNAVICMLIVQVVMFSDVHCK